MFFHHSRYFLQNLLLPYCQECSVVIINVALFNDVIDTKLDFHFAKTEGTSILLQKHVDSKQTTYNYVRISHIYSTTLVVRVNGDD
jgi:hypothetical protein